MTSFKDREEAFESKYKHDEELRFKTIARRNKLFGLWVAEQLGLAGGDAQHYARTVVQADMKMPGDEDVIEKVKTDLDQAGKSEWSEHRLHKRLGEFFEQAKQQVMSE
jgi:hypothetical protein